MIMTDAHLHSSKEERTTLKTILVVEDDTDVGDFLVQAIRLESHYQAKLVSDGFQALKTVRSLKPNLFLLDYQLPSMNGIELYDRLHAIKELADIPAIVFSANLPLQKARDRKLACLKKPVELDELLHTIEELLT
jgi:CheY-like chemotaxis protein